MILLLNEYTGLDLWYIPSQVKECLFCHNEIHDIQIVQYYSRAEDHNWVILIAVLWFTWKFKILIIIDEYQRNDILFTPNALRKYKKGFKTREQFPRLNLFSAVILAVENCRVENLKFLSFARWYVWEKDNVGRFDHPWHKKFLACE